MKDVLQLFPHNHNLRHDSFYAAFGKSSVGL